MIQPVVTVRSVFCDTACSYSEECMKNLNQTLAIILWKDAKTVREGCSFHTDKFQSNYMQDLFLSYCISFHYKNNFSLHSPTSFRCCATRMTNCYKVSALDFYTLKYISNKKYKRWETREQITLFRVMNHLYFSYTSRRILQQHFKYINTVCTYRFKEQFTTSLVQNK